MPAPLLQRIFYGGQTWQRHPLVQVTDQVLGEALHSSGVCSVVNSVGDDFLGQEAHVFHVVQVPEDRAGVEAQGLRQLLDAHGLAGHGSGASGPGPMGQQAQGVKLPVV